MTFPTLKGVSSKTTMNLRLHLKSLRSVILLLDKCHTIYIFKSFLFMSLGFSPGNLIEISFERAHPGQLEKVVLLPPGGESWRKDTHEEEEETVLHACMGKCIRERKKKKRRKKVAGANVKT